MARRGLSKQHASVGTSSEPLHRPSLPASPGADNLPLTIDVGHVDIDYHHVAMSLGLSTARTGSVQAVAGNRKTVRQCMACLFCAYDIIRPVDSEARLNPAVRRSRCSFFGCSISGVSVLAEDNAANMWILLDQRQA